MNLPNILTVLRIFFVPLLLAVMLHRDFRLDVGVTVLSSEWLALVIFLAAAITDLLDGYLARRRRQVTTMGKILDPIADKLLISAAFISLVELGRVPAWMVVIIVGREFAVSGLRNVAIAGGYPISASKLGKTKMVLQVVSVSLLLIATPNSALWDAAYVSLWLVVLFAVASMIDYFRSYWRKIETVPPRKTESRILSQRREETRSSQVSRL